MRREQVKLKLTERDLKNIIKDYLAIKGIFNFPITQGLGSYRGSPDRVMHFQGQAHYLEIKLPSGKLSDYQLAFQEQCQNDSIPYHIIRSLEDLMSIIEEAKNPRSRTRDAEAKA